MKASTYLKNYKIICQEIMRYQSMILDAQSNAVSIGGSGFGEKVQSSPNGDGILNAVIRLIEATEEYDEILSHLYYQKREMEKRVESVPNNIYRIILELVYFEGKTLKQTAEEMHYSEAYIRHIHPRALREFEKLYNMTKKEEP